MESIFTFLLGKVNAQHSFTLVDIGSLGGIPKKWDPISDQINIITFEPDERDDVPVEDNGHTRCFKCVLYNKKQDLKFYITKGMGRSSIYVPNAAFLSQFEDAERFHIDKVDVVSSEKVRTLDSIVEESPDTDVDFMKLDTQGSELPILEGCQDRVIPTTFGMQIEVEFIQMYEGQHLFRHVDEFMNENGFQLIDLRRQYWKRKDYYDYVGKGQIIFGDALYFKRIDVMFRELSSAQDKSYITSKIYKALTVCAVYRMFDYAISIAKTAVDEGHLSHDEYATVLSNLTAYSKKNVVPDFPGKGKLHALVNRIGRSLQPKSFLGWSNSDREIGNIKDA